MSNQAIPQKVNLFFRGSFPFSRFVVHEESMLPGYKPGDHVLTFNWSRLKAGDVVVFTSSLRGAKRRGNLFFIKRVDKYVDNYVYVSGDNMRKSAKVTPIKSANIVGKVILKY